MIRRLLTVLLVVVLVALVAVVGGYWYERPLLLTGTGYAAHNACAVQHVAGRSDPDADLPPNPLVPYLRSSTRDGTTTSTILGVAARQHATYHPGFGCTLGKEPPELPDPVPISGTNPFTSAPVEATPAVDAAIAAAFGDDLPESKRAALGTRGIVVVRDGRIIGERYAEGFDASTPQLGWSMSKSVTNLVAGRLVADGAITVEDDHLRPEWTDERAGITVEDLLRMTSGLEWDETYDLGTPVTRMLYLEPDMAGYVAGQPAAHPAGEFRQYSSGSTTLLCAVLAEQTGLGANLPRTTVFSPLGLTSAVGEVDGVGTPVCSSYLWATPRDWAGVGQFALQDGRWQGKQYLPDWWMTWSTRPTEAAGETEPYGAGWWLNRGSGEGLAYPTLPADAYFAQGHDGQWIVVVPSEKLVIVRLGFTPDGDDRVVPLVEQVVAAP